MKTRNSPFRYLLIALIILGTLGTVMAQEGTVIDPLELTNEPVVVEISTTASGPPTIEPLSDGRMTFRVEPTGSVTGMLDGTISAKVTEVTPNPSPQYHPITVIFTIETEQGVIEGYYFGSFYLPDGADQANVHAAGQILSVSGAYADLYLADVFVDSTVQFEDGRSVGESGTITIATR